MIKKIREGLVIETQGIKIVRVKQDFSEVVNVVISYFDTKKNPDEHIYCETKEEGNKLVDDILNAIKDSKTLRCF